MEMNSQASDGEFQSIKAEERFLSTGYDILRQSEGAASKAGRLDKAKHVPRLHHVLQTCHTGSPGEGQFARAISVSVGYITFVTHVMKQLRRRESKTLAASGTRLGYF